MLDAVERVAAVTDPVRPRRQHRAVAGGGSLVGVERCDHVAPADAVDAQLRTDVGDGRGLIVQREGDLEPGQRRRLVGHALTLPVDGRAGSRGRVATSGGLVELGCELVELVGQRAEHGGQLLWRVRGRGVDRLSSRCPARCAPWLMAAVPASWPSAATSGPGRSRRSPARSRRRPRLRRRRARRPSPWRRRRRHELSRRPAGPGRPGGEVDRALPAHPASRPASRPAAARATTVRRSMRRTSWETGVTSLHEASAPRGRTERCPARSRGRGTDGVSRRVSGGLACGLLRPDLGERGAVVRRGHQVLHVVEHRHARVGRRALVLVRRASPGRPACR